MVNKRRAPSEKFRGRGPASKHSLFPSVVFPLLIRPTRYARISRLDLTCQVTQKKELKRERSLNCSEFRGQTDASENVPIVIRKRGARRGNRRRAQSTECPIVRHRLTNCSGGHFARRWSFRENRRRRNPPPCLQSTRSSSVSRGDSRFLPPKCGLLLSSLDRANRCRRKSVVFRAGPANEALNTLTIA